MKLCELEDFGSDHTSKRFYQAWDGYLIICPDFKDGNRFQLFSDGIQMIDKTINIVF
jgi:hypothetical protein